MSVPTDLDRCPATVFCSSSCFSQLPNLSFYIGHESPSEDWLLHDITDHDSRFPFADREPFVLSFVAWPKLFMISFNVFIVS